MTNELREALEKISRSLDSEIAMHRCACPHPCEDYLVHPGPCGTRTAEAFRNIKVIADKALASLSDVETPEGWKLVPVEPTKEMIDEGWADALGEDAEGVYRAMLSAAPPPPTTRPIDRDAVIEECAKVVVTEAMLAAGLHEWHQERRFESDVQVILRIYCAMRAAEKAADDVASWSPAKQD